MAFKKAPGRVLIKCKYRYGAPEPKKYSHQATAKFLAPK